MYRPILRQIPDLNTIARSSKRSNVNHFPTPHHESSIFRSVLQISAESSTESCDRAPRIRRRGVE